MGTQPQNKDVCMQYSNAAGIKIQGVRTPGERIGKLNSGGGKK